jgi:hypothetical protein
MDTPFYYRLTLHQGSSSGITTATWVNRLPLIQQITDQVVVMPDTEGTVSPGMYVWDGSKWRFILPYTEVSQAIIVGSTLDVFYNVNVEYDGLPSNAVLWRNGLKTTGQTVLAGDGYVWIGVSPAASSGGTVSSVNDVTPDGSGNIDLEIANIPDLQTELDNAGSVKTVNNTNPDEEGNVAIPLATVDTVGTVKGGGNIAIAGDGTMSVSLTGEVHSVNSQTPDVNGNVIVQAEAATTDVGLSLVTDSGSTTGVIKLKTLNNGGGIAIDNSTNPDVMVIYTEGVVTSINTIDPDDTGNVTLAFPVASVSGQTGTVVIKAEDNSDASGTSLITDGGATTGVIKMKTLVEGSGITLTADGNGNLEIAGSSQYTLPVATTTVLGGVKQGSNVTIAGDGTISAAAYTLPDATTTVLGGVKQGANVTITAGVIAVAAPYTLPFATTTILGGVMQGSNVTISDTGVISVAAPTEPYTLPVATVSVLGGVKQGTNITIAGDGTISASESTYTLPIATASVLGGVMQGANVAISGTGVISVAAPYSLPIATGSVLGGVIPSTGLAVDGEGRLTADVPSVNGLTGALTIVEGSNVSITSTGTVITIASSSISEAPDDGNVYGRQNDAWTLVPSAGQIITSITGQTGSGAVNLVEASPPANSAIIKSLVQGNNITITDNEAGLITIAASIPAGTVSTVNSVSPDGSGNVSLSASSVNALPIAGGTMLGEINMGSEILTGLTTPVSPSDAVPLSYVSSLSIDNGTF